MAVLEALAQTAKYRDPDAYFLKSAGALSKALGNLNSKARIKNFGNDLLGQLEQGQEIDQKTFVGLIQKNRLSPEETGFALDLLQKSGAITEALRKSKLGQTTLGTVAKNPMEATAEQLNVFPQEARKAMFPEQTKGNPIKTSPGDIVINESGKEIYRHPQSSKTGKTNRIKTSPGDIVIDEQGKEIYRHPEKEKTGKQYTEREALKEIRGIDKQIVDLKANKGLDPVKLGLLKLINPEMKVENVDVNDAIQTFQDHKEYLYRKFVNKKYWPDEIKKPKEFRGSAMDWRSYK